MPTPPPLTDTQRKIAYDRSLALRRARAEVKRGLAEYDPPAELLAYLWEQYPVQGMLVMDLLTAMRGIGPVKAGRIMEKARIHPRRKVQGVGTAQRDRLFALL